MSKLELSFLPESSLILGAVRKAFLSQCVRFSEPAVWGRCSKLGHIPDLLLQLLKCWGDWSQHFFFFTICLQRVFYRSLEAWLLGWAVICGQNNIKFLVPNKINKELYRVKVYFFHWDGQAPHFPGPQPDKNTATHGSPCVSTTVIGHCIDKTPLNKLWKDVWNQLAGHANNESKYCHLVANLVMCFVLKYILKIIKLSCS